MCCGWKKKKTAECSCSKLCLDFFLVAGKGSRQQAENALPILRAVTSPGEFHLLESRAEEDDARSLKNLVAHMTERAESLIFSGSVERWTTDELRELEALRKAHVDEYEDGMMSRLRESTPFMFCLIATSDIDELLLLDEYLQQHVRSDFDEIMNDAVSPGECQSSDASSMIDLSNEDDTSMLDEDEDRASAHRDSGCESDQDMDCDPSEMGEPPEGEDQFLEMELASMMICDAEP
ncbi:uncharacterized protein MYCFIDRAFT_197369 [Pseudocercospora fijiensis CIRAD86]|uniref:Uncharacterized protein n=1 Tax=Pseudocercospora fijiensis (strain CIRAD86) TaxID=383855 RepID=M3AYC9_PSEFD|nr:uncharacterized protein MYCFIDRAFT_197369 [Pseudocercospora fijiensis CIRAD86]EME82173.1 hypothetical protein MYCFIDRAFT_197369 [Pseudocercospora fijiensis CIRAD86]